MRVVYVGHQNPYPPQSGLHQRMLSMLEALNDLGMEVYLVASTIYANRAWTEESIFALERGYVSKVLLHRGSRGLLFLSNNLPKVYGVFQQPVSINSWLYRLPGLQAWFTRLLSELNPDVIWMNYSFWDGIIDHEIHSSVFKVIDIHDLTSLNRKMSLAAYYDLRRHSFSNRSGRNNVLNEDYYQCLRLRVDPHEYAVFDRYDITLAINPVEAQLIQQNTCHTKVVYLPMDYSIPTVKNHYRPVAIFPMGPNIFNVQGYLYFISNVMPLVRKACPDFCLQVTGPGSVGLPPEDGVQYSGVLPDLKDAYRMARLAICPVFGGTGQKIKIIEALAYGLPVVALRASAEGSPLVHGENGYIADDSITFADYVISLWNDSDLCRKLGANGREKIAHEASREVLLRNLSTVLPQTNQRQMEGSR